MPQYTIHLLDFSEHTKAQEFIDHPAKLKIARAGRRGAKTTAVSQMIVKAFLKGRRVVYGAPVADQLESCWYEIVNALREPLEAGVLKKDETEHSIEKPGSKQRIRLKTAYNADTWRGDYGDMLIFDEWQLMNEDVFEVVCAPMLMDTDGDAIFLYTPPKLQAPARSNVTSKARDPGHAANMFKAAKAEMEAAAKEGRPSRWFAASWTSKDNPYLSEEGLYNATLNMSSINYAREILVDEDADDEGSFRQEWLRFYTYKPSQPDKPLDDETNYLLVHYHVPPKAHENEPDEEQPEDIFAGSLELRLILDPNHAGKNGRCKHAIAVVGFDAATMKFHLLDEWAESVGYRDMGEQLFRMCEKWGLFECWIEAVASQVYCKLYLEELNSKLKRKIKFHELPKDNRANAKDRRIESLEPYFRNQQFWIHREKCKQFKAEYSSYYRGKMIDVDLLDCIAYAPQLFTLIQRKQVAREINRRADEWQQREASVTGY